MEAMQRTGGFETLENNVYYSERYDPTKSVDYPQMSLATDATTASTYQYFQSWLNLLIARNMCALHSIGKKAEFVTFVNHLGSTLLKAVSEYESKFSYNDLTQAVSRVKNSSKTEIWLLFDCIEDIRDALNKDCISELGLWSLGKDIKCKGIVPLQKILPYITNCYFSLQNFIVAFHHQDDSDYRTPQPCH